MNQDQTQQRSQMIQRTVMRVCLLYVVSCAVCVAIITNLWLALLILALLLPIHLLVLVSIPESLNGVPDEELSRRNFVTTLPVRLAKLLTPKT